MANKGRMAVIVEEIRSLREKIAVYGTKRRRCTPDESLRLRARIGVLADEYQRLADEDGVTGAMAILGTGVNWTEAVLLQHRQFHDQISSQPDLLEEYVQRGLTWREVVKRLPGRVRRRHQVGHDRGDIDIT